jgi:peptide/nickel transport system substrate-binding protein
MVRQETTVASPRIPLRTLVAVGAVVVLIAGWASGSSRASTAVSAPQTGGTLTIGWDSSPSCLDPQLANSSLDLSIDRQFSDSLIDQAYPSGKLVPWLASSWSSNANATQFTFHLRSGVTFSDGTPLTAAVVKANFDSIVKLGSIAEGSGYMSGYKGTTVVNPTTVLVRFAQPDAQFLQAASTVSLSILSPSTLTKKPAARCAGGFSGSGPFVLSSFTPNQQVTLTSRPGYDWGAADRLHTGAAYLSTIVFKIIPDASVRVGALTSGEVDAISDIPPQNESPVKADGDVIVSQTNPGVPYGLQINSQAGPLADLAVRQAIQLAVNRNLIVQTLLTPSYKAAVGVLASNTPDAVDQTTNPYYVFNPTKAETLLTADGWVPGAGGIRSKDGQKLTVSAIYVNLWAPDVPILELIQQELATVGIQLQIKALPLSQFVTDLFSPGGRTYQMIWYGQTRADPDVLALCFAATQYNRSNITASNPLESLLTSQATTTNAQERAAIVAKAENTILDQGYFIPVVNQTTVLATNSKVHNFEFDDTARLQLYDTWLSS